MVRGESSGRRRPREYTPVCRADIIIADSELTSLVLELYLYGVLHAATMHVGSIASVITGESPARAFAEINR